MVAVALLVAGLVVILVTVLVCLISLLSRRSEPPASITEAQARENAAPLTTAILPSDRRVADGPVMPLLAYAFHTRLLERRSARGSRSCCAGAIASGEPLGRGLPCAR